MSALINQEHTRRAALWRAIQELEIVSSFFSWLFMLFTRLAEPFMLLATLYVIAETGVPAIALPALHSLSIGVMITSPELLLPGAFVVASKAREQQRKQAQLLYLTCWLFVTLTLATLLDLFLLHLSGPGLAALMFMRCGMAVSYSILMRTMHHGATAIASVSVASLTEHLQAMEVNTARLVAESEHRFTELARSLEQTFSERLEQLAGDQARAASLVDLAALEQQLRASLEQGPGRPKLALVEHLPADRANTSEQPVDKAAFVRSCFTEHPAWRNADIRRAALEQGVNISPAYISGLRKAFSSEQEQSA